MSNFFFSHPVAKPLTFLLFTISLISDTIRKISLGCCKKTVPEAGSTKA